MCTVRLMCTCCGRVKYYRPSTSLVLSKSPPTVMLCIGFAPGCFTGMISCNPFDTTGRSVLFIFQLGKLRLCAIK